MANTTERIANRLASVLAEKAVASVWVVVAAGIILFGNGESDLISIILFSPKVNRVLTNIALLCLAVNTALFTYIYFWLQYWCDVDRPLAAAPWVERYGAATFSVAFVSLILGLWPVFTFLTPVMTVAVLYGAIMALHFIPTFGLLKPLGTLGSGLGQSSTPGTTTTRPQPPEHPSSAAQG